MAYNYGNYYANVNSIGAMNGYSQQGTTYNYEEIKRKFDKIEDIFRKENKTKVDAEK